LETALKDLPGKEKEIEEAKRALLPLKAEQVLAEIERAQKAGRHGWARTQIEKFARDGVDDKQLAQLRNLKAKSDSSDTALKSARRYLKDVLARLPAGSEARAFEAAVAAILEELHADNVGRLEAFVQYADQDERKRKQ